MNVVAAIIVREGSILICQRKPGGEYGGKWEFPGGKVEPDEDFRAALARELEEELAIRAVIGPEVDRYEYGYPGRSAIQLIFYKVTVFEGQPQNLIFEQIQWERAENLPAYDFLAGDLDFVQKLARDGV